MWPNKRESFFLKIMKGYCKISFLPFINDKIEVVCA